MGAEATMSQLSSDSKYRVFTRIISFREMCSTRAVRASKKCRELQHLESEKQCTTNCSFRQIRKGGIEKSLYDRRYDRGPPHM